MRIGLMVGSDKERPLTDRLAGLLADARVAENAGFTSFWMPQVPRYLDAMTAVALIGQVTQRVELGTAMVPIQTRHPIIMAQQALTTDIMCGGRFTPWSRSLASMDHQRPAGSSVRQAGPSDARLSRGVGSVVHGARNRPSHERDL
jgi:Luciferase-like monooxygenase